MKIKTEKDSKNNWYYRIFLVLFLAGALQVFIYFFFIYKPANAIFNKGRQLYLELPPWSQLLSNKQITDESVSLEDLQSNFYPENLNRFTNDLSGKISGPANTFVKNAESSMTIAGDVVSKNTTGGGDLELKLSNSAPDQYTVRINKQVLNTIKASLFIISPENPNRSETQLEDIQIGDFVILKYRYGLLKESEIIIQAEIYRKDKS